MEGTLLKLEGLQSEHFAMPTVEVWLPDVYDATKPHAVLYLLDGQSLFDPTLTWANQAWEVDKSLSRLIRKGEISPTIVVGIWHHPDTRNTDYLPQKVFDALPTGFQQELTDNGKDEIRSDAQLKFIVQELKPYIDEHYATHRAAAHTFIMGSSMGALLALYALGEYPQVFGGCGCLSPHWCLVLDENEKFASTAFADNLEKQLPAPGSHTFYIDMGTHFYDNRNLPYQPAIDAIFEGKGYGQGQYASNVFEGHNHSEVYWAMRFPNAVSFLLR